MLFELAFNQQSGHVFLPDEKLILATAQLLSVEREPVEKAFRRLLDKYKPGYLIHGHVHMNYGHDISREIEYNGTRICNCTERYELDIPELPHPKLKHNELIWKTKYKDPYPSTNRQGYSYY